MSTIHVCSGPPPGRAGIVGSRPRPVPWGATALAVLLLLPASRALAALPDPSALPSPVVIEPADSSVIDAPGDPLVGVIHRIDAYFHRHELAGITLDPRYALNPTETIRLSVVSQLLGYLELRKVFPTKQSYYDDIVERADFLVDHFDEITSRTAFDGMLGYALLGAWEVVGDARYLANAQLIVQRSIALSGFNNTLNWGLMSALATSKYYALTGDPVALRKTREIVQSLLYYQHADGSFPHYCPSSTDIHYSGWMAMELITVGRYVPGPSLDLLLERVNSFLKTRVDAEGRTSYQEPCAYYPGCTTYYFSIATGCYQDYDTRAWVNELGYHAMCFDYFQEAKYHDVMGFLYGLETNGTFPDKWDFPPPLSDPIYPWASADSSVIRASVLFWSLASIYSGRMSPKPARYAASPGTDPVGDLALADGGAPPPTAVDDTTSFGGEFFESGVFGGPRPGPNHGHVPGPEQSRPEASGDLATGARILPVVPNPTRAGADVRFLLTSGGPVMLEILDAGGRRVRELAAGRLSPGAHSVHWDARDAAGRTAPGGLYFVRLRFLDRTTTTRLVLSR